MPGSLQM